MYIHMYAYGQHSTKLVLTIAAETIIYKTRNNTKKLILFQVGGYKTKMVKFGFCFSVHDITLLTQPFGVIWLEN